MFNLRRIESEANLTELEITLNAFNLKKKKLKKKVNKILFIQPLQIEEEKLDVKVALNKRYYMYPPYGLGILNAVTKKAGYDSKLLDLNFNVFNHIHQKKHIVTEELTNKWRQDLQHLLKKFSPDLGIMYFLSCS